MKAISIKQPWAYAILHCGKDIENREWYTKYRGEFLIHASKKFDMEGYNFIKNELNVNLPSEWKEFPRGCIVGKVFIIDCVKNYDSKWFFGPFGFVLMNPIALEYPKEWKGQLGFFEVNYDF